MDVQLIVKTIEEDMKANGFTTKIAECTSLGSGSYSKVHLCIKHNDGKRYAVKIASTAWPWLENKPKITSSPINGQFVEANFLKFIPKHRNIVELKSEFTSQGVLALTRGLFLLKSHFLVLKYAEDGSLKEWLQLNRKSDDKIKFLGRDLISAVQHLHSLNIAHCDIKPANCLLYRDSSAQGGLTLKLADFNLCQTRMISDGVYGTVTTRAPEMLRNQYYREYNLMLPPNYLRPIELKPADLWSVGATLFYAYHREYPLINHGRPIMGRLIEIFRNRATIALDPSEMYERIRGFLPPLKSSLTNSTVAVLSRLLEVNPADRQLTEQLIEAWIEDSSPVHQMSQPTLIPDV